MPSGQPLGQGTCALEMLAGPNANWTLDPDKGIVIHSQVEADKPSEGPDIEEATRMAARDMAGTTGSNGKHGDPEMELRSTDDHGNVTAIKLVAMEWGSITLRSNAAVATTWETWSTTYADGQTREARDRNDYRLIFQNGAWKIDGDTQRRFYYCCLGWLYSSSGARWSFTLIARHRCWRIGRQLSQPSTRQSRCRLEHGSDMRRLGCLEDGDA